MNFPFLFSVPYFTNFYFITLSKIPLAPMGVLAPRLRTLDGSARPPINMSGNFTAHVSAESPLNTSPNPSEVIS